jgi:hypothetical protein
MKRKPDESFEDYKARRKGMPFWCPAKQGPYNKKQVLENELKKQTELYKERVTEFNYLKDNLNEEEIKIGKEGIKNHIKKIEELATRLEMLK